MTNPYGAKVPLKRALVIDDEPIINRLNEKILRFLQIETECRNGLDGLKENQINKLKTYDILIIDLNLIKNTEGRIFGLLKQLKDQIPVLITSGYLKETAKEYLDQYDHIDHQHHQVNLLLTIFDIPLTFLRV